MDKTAYRKQINEKLKLMDNAFLDESSQNICKTLQNFDFVSQYKHIAVYHPLSDEVNILPYIQHLLSQNVNIYLPTVISSENPLMMFSKYENEEVLKKGSYGIYEPNNTQEVPLTTLELMILPGVCFDNNGNRMGRGKGYYDTYLDNEEKGNLYKVGICFDFQVFDAIPVSEHDKKVDLIITENRVITPL